MSGNEVDYLYVAEIIGSWTMMAGLAAGYVNLFAVVAIVTLPLLIASVSPPSPRKRVLGSCLFATSAIVLYTASTG